MALKQLSYTKMTAASASQGTHISFSTIKEAVVHRDKMTLMKVMWEIGVAVANMRRELQAFQVTCQSLKQQLDAFLLACAELKKSPLAQLTDEQRQERINLLEESLQASEKFKNSLRAIEQEIIFLEDFQEMIQKNFRQQFGRAFKKFEENQIEKSLKIIKILEQQGFEVKNPAVFEMLKEKLLDSAVQEAYFKSVAGETEVKNFSKRLKEWFK